MLLLELYNEHVPDMQDMSTDGTQMKWEDSRKTKLTLKQIGRLRKMNDMRTCIRHRWIEYSQNWVNDSWSSPKSISWFSR